MLFHEETIRYKAPDFELFKCSFVWQLQKCLALHYFSAVYLSGASQLKCQKFLED